MGRRCDPFCRIVRYDKSNLALNAQTFGAGTHIAHHQRTDQGNKRNDSVNEIVFVILFAGLFDMMDGRVARLGNMSSKFGALYDSVL